jgi:hypothetical protein
MASTGKYRFSGKRKKRRRNSWDCFDVTSARPPPPFHGEGEIRGGAATLGGVARNLRFGKEQAQMIKIHSEGFEKQLRVFEQNLYMHYKNHFDLNCSFFRQLSDVIDERKNDIGPETDFQKVINFLFGRSYRLYWTTLVLCGKGFGPEGCILVRSLMEQVVNMHWIAKENPDQRAKLFLDYVHVARKILYERYEKHKVLHQLTDVEKQWMENPQEIDRRYNEVKENYVDERHWAPESIRSRAQSAGAAYDWDFYYWQFSSLVHSNPASQFEFITSGEPNGLFVVGPSKLMIRDVLHLNNKYMLLAFDLWNKVFELGLDGLVQELSDKLGKVSFIRLDEQGNSGE